MLILGSSVMSYLDEVMNVHVIMALGMEKTKQLNSAESEVSFDSTELLFLIRITSSGSTKNIGGTVRKSTY